MSKVNVGALMSSTYRYLDQRLNGEMYGLDGKLIIHPYNEYIASHIGVYLDILATKHPIKDKQNDFGKYCGITANIPSKSKGIYVIGYKHPITGAESYYIGSSVKCIRDRLGMMARLIMTGKANGKESLTVPNRWVEKHGRNFDYAFFSYCELDFPQAKMRAIETLVTDYYREMFGPDVINAAESATLTLEKKIPTPALDGLDI